MKMLKFYPIWWNTYNAQAWVQLQEMLEEHTLHYRRKGQEKEEPRKNYTISRKKFLDLLETTV